MTCDIQSDCFISVQSSYSTLKYFYDIVMVDTLMLKTELMVQNHWWPHNKLKGESGIQNTFDLKIVAKQEIENVLIGKSRNGTSPLFQAQA